MEKIVYCCDYCEKEFNNENDYKNHVEECIENPSNTMDIWKYKFEFNFDSQESKFEEIFLGKVKFEKMGNASIFIKTTPSVPDEMQLQKEVYTDYVVDKMLGKITVDRFSVSKIISLCLYSEKKLDNNILKKEFLKNISKRIEEDIKKLELKKYEIDLMIDDENNE